MISSMSVWRTSMESPSRLSSRQVHQGRQGGTLEYGAKLSDQVGGLDEGVVAPQRCVRGIDRGLERGAPLRRDFLHARDVRTGEEEALGIDDAVADEGAGLAGAATRVARVHEAAVSPHEVSELSAGASEPLPEVVRAQLEHLGGHRVADLEKLAEHEDQMLLAVQAQEHAQHAAQPGLLDDEPLVGGHGVEIGWLLVGGTSEVREALLCRVLGVLSALEHPERDVVEPALMTAQELLERISLARKGTRDELLVRGGRRVRFRERVHHGGPQSRWTEAIARL